MADEANLKVLMVTCKRLLTCSNSTVTTV
jgi:hypothetical protein